MTKWKETEIGRIPEEWGRIRIGDLFFVKNGKTNTQDAVTNGNYPLFDRSTQIKSSNKYLFDSEAIIIPGEGKEFVPRYFSGKFDLHQRAYAITPKTKNICVKFFYYWMYYYRTYLERIAVGSTVRSLRLDHLVSFPAPNPTLEEQQAISKILSDLDSKIELNNQMNATLEAMAQAIFKHWFIDFEFPDENGRPYKSSGGKMVDSELGEIPEGWEIKTISEIADVKIGRTPPRKESEWFSTTSGIKWISIKDLGSATPFILNTAERLTSHAMNRFKVPIIAEGTVMLSFKLTVGRVAIAAENMLSNEAIAHFNIKGRITTPYLYGYLKNFDYNSLGSTSSIATAINSENIKDIKIVIPSFSIQKVYEQLVNPYFERIKQNTKSSNILIKMRDSLLPKLMSGQIRVPVEVIKNA